MRAHQKYVLTERAEIKARKNLEKPNFGTLHQSLALHCQLSSKLGLFKHQIYGSLFEQLCSLNSDP